MLFESQFLEGITKALTLAWRKFEHAFLERTFEEFAKMVPQSGVNAKLQQPEAGGGGSRVPDAMHFPFLKQQQGGRSRNDLSCSMADGRCSVENQAEFFMPMGVPIDHFSGRQVAKPHFQETDIGGQIHNQI